MCGGELQRLCEVGPIYLERDVSAAVSELLPRCLASARSNPLASHKPMGHRSWSRSVGAICRGRVTLEQWF